MENKMSAAEFKMLGNVMVNKLKSTVKKKRGNPEEDMQRSCVAWFKAQYPAEIIIASVNGASLSGTPQKRAFQWSRLLSSGALPGCPDVFIPRPNKEYAGLWIENKIKPNKPSPEQIIVMDKLRSKGYQCVVCYSLDEFMRVVDGYFLAV